MTEQIRNTVIIAVGNQKGGVGKTTNTIQLAGALTERGRRSLIVDLDMTSGATKALRAPTEGWNSSFELLTGAENAEDTIITNDEPEVAVPPNVHLVPSSRKLAELDTWLLQNPWCIHQNLLMNPMEQLRGRYDYIFLDTPPQKTTTTIPALKVADFAVLSAMPDHLAVSALSEALADIAAAQRSANPNLALFGVVVCALPRRRHGSPGSWWPTWSEPVWMAMETPSSLPPRSAGASSSRKRSGRVKPSCSIGATIRWPTNTGPSPASSRIA